MHFRHHCHELEHQYIHPILLDATVMARDVAYGRVRTPHLEVGICDRLACCSVDKVDIQVCDGSLFTREQVLADKFTNDP